MSTEFPDPNAQIFEQYRGLLFSIAYRMLGSAMEAEDMVQEAYLRFNTANEDAIQSTKAYLTTIITHLCLDHLKSAKTQREQYVGMWLPEPVQTDRAPGIYLGEPDSISMAFLVLLEHLTPIERAIFILRDVFDYSYTEIAPMVDKTEANCRRYYHRAKQFLMERRPRFAPSTDEQQKLVESFMQAVLEGDLEGLTQLLTEDITFYGDGGGKVTALKQPIQGREAVKRFLMLGIHNMLPHGVHLKTAEVNGAPSLVLWVNARPYFVMTFTIVGNQIQAIRNVLNPDKLTHIHPSESGESTPSEAD